MQKFCTICIHSFLKEVIYFCLHWAFVAVHGLSLVAASRGYFLVAVHRLLIAVASLVVAPRLKSIGSVVLALGLSCSVACSTACSMAPPDWGLNLCLLHWQADSLPLDHEGNPQVRSWREKLENMREAKDTSLLRLGDWKELASIRKKSL